jgi:hypothetical protein
MRLGGLPERMLDSDETACGPIDDASKRKFGSLLAIGQGLITAAAPGLSVALTRKLLGMNFENAGELEARPAYLRQTRALGIGVAAAGIAGYAMEVATSEEPAADDEAATDGDAPGATA